MTRDDFGDFGDMPDVEVGFPPVEQFSSNYDLTQLRVVPVEHPEPRINDELYSEFQHRDDQDRDVPHPTICRLPRTSFHFEVLPDPGVPVDTMEVPYRLVGDLDLGQVPADEDFLVARSRHVVRLHRMMKVGEASVDRIQ